MNGNPNAEQKRYHLELREMCYYEFGGRGQLHHIFGSKSNFKGFVKPGEWLQILLTPEVHADIKSYSFKAERGMFLAQQRAYERYWGKPSPVPADLVEVYKAMLDKHSVSKAALVAR